MWKIFKSKENNSPSSPLLRVRLNTDMDYLGLDTDIQKGFLFFLGASINIGFNKSKIDLSEFNKNEVAFTENLSKTINAYSKSSGDFSDYGELNDYVFTSYIYSINYVFHNILAESNIDNHLRKVDFSGSRITSVIGKTDLIDDFISPYSKSTDSKFKLNNYHNLVESFFKRIGGHLTETGFDNYKSYEAGYAYYSMQSHLDVKGTAFMLETIFAMLPPMYMALHSYPILHLFQPNLLDLNHIFSNTLQMFYGGIDPNVVQPIHRFHQHIFYSAAPWKFSKENSSSNFSWKFNLKNDVGFQTAVLEYASRIKESGLVDNVKPFIDSGQVHNKELIHSKIDKNEFYRSMFNIVFEKYHIAPTNGEGGWNNLGDFIQYCAVLFYETCLHAIVVEELIE